MARIRPRPTGRITTIREALERAEPRPTDSAAATAKKNYAEKLSRNIATCIANALRPRFPGILPSETGEQQESRARTSKGLKKLDVNYSTLELGLGLGVSIKTINFRDAGTRRYTKNYSRNDNELRAESTDYHQRQPYAVLVGVLFLPIDSCDDAQNSGENAHSSFGSCVKYFRARANRITPRDDIDLFERFFVALYEPTGERMGETVFFDTMKPPPKNRKPSEEDVLTFDQLIEAITQTYDARNNPRFDWAD